MMSKKQWFALLCVFMCYLLFGASVFYMVESREEVRRLIEEKHEREDIEDLLKKHYVPNEEHTTQEIFNKISAYCDKPLGGNIPHAKTNLTWTFYHAIFFVMTIVSTIGYGNLSPTTPFTRTFMILYGLIGIPINGMVVITLGEFFGKSFLKLYKRWKTSRVQHAVTTLGLIGQIVLYSIPGLTLFIFLPSLIIVLYENWSFAVALEFAIATLTTIGVGRNVPGISQNDEGEVIFAIYRSFLLIWIVMGLGYLAMVFGFISRGLQSKKLHALEHKIAQNIKKTNRKVRQELRSILNEYLLMRVKRVYRERRTCIPMSQRTQSCPDLRLDREAESPKMRKRAYSELTRPSSNVLIKMQSDTDLHRIDKERTFVSENETSESSQFLLRVANALGNYYDTIDCTTKSVTKENSSENEDSDTYDSQWSFTSSKQPKAFDPMRPRAASESKKEKAAINFKLSRFKVSENRRMQELREREKYGKARSRTLPSIPKSQGLFIRFKNSFKIKESKNLQSEDVESQNCAYTNEISKEESKKYKELFTVINKNQLLEETSIADLLRALNATGVPKTSRPQRKFGVTQGVTPKVRRLPIVPTRPSLQTRTMSLIPESPSQETKPRRFSLNPTTIARSNEDNFRSSVFPATVDKAEGNRTVSTTQQFSSKIVPSGTVRRRVSFENVGLKAADYKKETF